MSITSDIRNYADTALEQGKQFTDTAKENVSGLTSKATGAVLDLRTQAEKTINVDAIKTAVEPYLAQAKQYRSTVTDRAEGLFESVKSDKRVAKVITTAESFTGVVVETVQGRVVAPVLSLTGRGTKPAPKKKPAAKASSKPAVTRPAKKAPAKKAASKSTATKATASATKRTTRKAPAKKAAQS
jgi:hypothetical protein